MSLIKFIKDLFTKRKDFPKSAHLYNKLSSIKELNLSNAEKVERLIKDKLYLDEQITDEMHLRTDLGGDEMDIMELYLAIEDVFDIRIQDGAFLRTVGNLKDYVEKKINNPDYIVPDEELLYEDSGFSDLFELLDKENLSMRSKAINELVDRSYVIMVIESRNPFKELINFTLNYFANGNFENRDSMLNIINAHFPIMNVYVTRQLNIINPNLQIFSSSEENSSVDLNVQKGYDEFLDFVYVTLTNSFVDKINRDNYIRNNFSISSSDLIAYIDKDIKKNKRR